MAAKPSTLRDVWDTRKKERKIFLWCFFCVAIGFLLFFGVEQRENQQVRMIEFLPLAVYGASLLLIHFAMVLFKSETDPLLLGPVVFLSGFGLLAQYRMGAFDLTHPLRLGHFAYPLAIGVMLCVWLLLRRGRYVLLDKLGWLAALASLGLLVALLTLGREYRGALYGPDRMTPTEILKVLVVVFTASYLTRNLDGLRRKDGTGPWLPWKIFLPLGAFWIALAGLLAVQRDLGMLFILGLVTIVMIYIATGHLRYLGYAALALGVGGILVFLLFPHGQRRLVAWVNPFEDPTGAGWQVLQGLSGMYAGGFRGAGFAMGDPERIPIAESDFIYAVIGEEMGYLGCLLVVLFFILFAVRAFKIAASLKEPFPMLLVSGLTTVIVGQAFLNIAGVTKSLPLTGVTLPFISHGGSSLVTGFVALGLIMAVADGKLKSRARND